LPIAVGGRAIGGIRAERGEEEELEGGAADEGRDVDRRARPIEEHPVAHPAAVPEDAPGGAERVGRDARDRPRQRAHWSESVASRRALASTKTSATRAPM
jgi:hypothetical protein